MIRILHVLKELDAGGVERMLSNYYTHVNQKEYQFDFMVFSDHEGMIEKTIKNSTIHHVTAKEINVKRHIKETNQVIKEGHYDIVHTHIDKMALIPLLSAKWHKVPGRFAHSHMAIKKGMQEKLTYPVIKSLSTDLCACGIDAGTIRFGEKVYIENKITIVNNAIEIPKFIFKQGVREKVRNELQLAEDETALCCVARFDYQKNHSYLLKVFKEYKELNPRAKLFLFGTGELEQEIQSQVNELDIKDVIFMGTRDDVHEILQGMDIFLLTSFYEGLPVVLVEAQCTGISCFVSNKITKEIKITDDIHYLDIEQDPADWAKIIYEKTDLKRDRSGAYKQIEASGYSIVKESKKLEALYSKYGRRG
ncbi:glycosyltransferase [Carnobacterium viridans]|uniref:Glycosyltransferase involved in cell wall bisynthesis n=1 Tax=Carnobacterium viridans TaxID=174587 RepID=A0A1H0YGC5_9LACT|nr:glycosyltransferase [Carnobacterium viridans]UDE95152.1 glycosyltransferase [Carnobacterium viridans]SDQ14090.1 Glycosyltransferase involved in cell wall bisynthesis [Carnobacterium viridans]